MTLLSKTTSPYHFYSDRDTRMEDSRLLSDGAHYTFETLDNVNDFGLYEVDSSPNSVSDGMDDGMEFISANLPQAVDVDTDFFEYFPDSAGSEPVIYDLTNPVNKIKIFNADVSPKTPTNWTRHYPNAWTSDEVYSWIMDVATNPHSGIVCSAFRGENFHCDGQTLCSMSREQFRQADVVYGDILYNCLQDLLANCSPLTAYHGLELPFVAASQGSGLPSFDEMFRKPTNASGPTNSWPMDAVIWFPDDESSSCSDGVYGSPGAGISLVPEPVEQLNTLNSFTPVTDPYSGIESLKHKPTKNCHKQVQNVPQWAPKQATHNASVHKKRGPNRPACIKPNRRGSVSSNSDNDDSDDGKTPSNKRPVTPRKSGEGFKGKHLWEFIRDLLHNNQSNPSLIRWEDSEEGIFRIVNSREVARLWGNRKGNSDMTYEKLSRAMRFCRTANYFENVPRDRNLPRKLCFKFGPKAEDWQCPALHTTPSPLSNRLRRLAMN